jgi:predicted Zn-dependent protease
VKRQSGDDLVALADSGVRRALAAGAVQAEVYAVDMSIASVDFRGRLGEIVQNAEGGVCVRLAVGQRFGYAGNPGLSAESIDRAIERALVNVRSLPEDARFRHYPDPQPVTAPPTHVDAEIFAPDADRLVADAKQAAQSVSGQEDVTYLAFSLRSESVIFGVANSRGVAVWDQDARESFRSELRVSNGGSHKTANEFALERVPVSRRHDLGALIDAAAKRARQALDARPLAGVLDTVIFDPLTTAQVTGTFLDDLAQAGARKEGLIEKRGQRVASPAVTLADTPHRVDGSRCQRIDDEGVPTYDRTLIHEGVLGPLTTNSFVAHQAGNASTGNGYRPFDGRWNATPKMRHASLDMAAGAKRVEALLAGVDRAVYVRDHLLGYFTSNPMTGDFSTVAPMAFLVEKGQIVHALPPATVAGNAFRLMENIDETSSDRRTLLRGTFPSVRAHGLTVATR